MQSVLLFVAVILLISFTFREASGNNNELIEVIKARVLEGIERASKKAISAGTEKDSGVPNLKCYSCGLGKGKGNDCTENLSDAKEKTCGGPASEMSCESSFINEVAFSRGCFLLSDDRKNNLYIVPGKCSRVISPSTAAGDFISTDCLCNTDLCNNQVGDLDIKYDTTGGAKDLKCYDCSYDCDKVDDKTMQRACPYHCLASKSTFSKVRRYCGTIGQIGKCVEGRNETMCACNDKNGCNSMEFNETTIEEPSSTTTMTSSATSAFFASIIIWTTLVVFVIFE